MPRRGLGPRYWRLWTASTVSGAGNGLRVVALPLLATRLTSDVSLVAALVAAQQLPWLVVGLPAGALADRVDRASLMRWIDVARTVLLAAFAVLVATNAVTLPLLYVAAFVLGALEAVFSAAAAAAIPAVVDESDYDRANGYLYASETAGEQLAGPAAGGAFFAIAPVVPFVLDAVSFIGSALLLRRVRVPSERAPAHARSSIRRDVAEGLRFFMRHRLLRTLACVMSGMAFFQSAVFGILVIFVVRTLGVSEAGYGIFLGVAAVGNVAGGMCAEKLTTRLGSTRVVLFGGVAAACAYVAMSLLHSPVIAAAVFGVEAFAVAVGSVASLSLRQAAVPDQMRGRTSSAFRTVLYSAAPAGALVGGVVAAAVSVPFALATAGFAQLLLLVALSGRLSRAVQAAGRNAADERSTTSAEPELVGAG